MRYKKEFWIAIFLFICTAVVISSFFKSGFATYKLCGSILFPFLGIAFLRRALK